MIGTTTAHTDRTRSTAWSVFSFLLVVASLAILFAAPSVARAATAGPMFPRIAIWWPNSDTQSVAQRAGCDWIAMQNYDAHHIAELRAANPNIIVLGSTSARELNYYVADYNHAVNVELRSVSTDWMLTQVGSKLTSGITASTTSIPVADTAKFAVGEMALVDHELVRIESIGSGALTVTRGQVTPTAAHASGVRIASVVTNWPGSITFDMSTNCPKRDVGYGLETWSDWNARRGASILAGSAWDGLLIDCFEGNPHWMVTGGKNRSIDPLRTNVPVTDNYAAFDTAWNSGATVYGNSLRAAAGTKMLIGNGNMRNYNMNGNIYEEFPYANVSLSTWNLIFVGPYSYPRASYPEWMANVSARNLTLIQTYGAQTNYQLMRFGLTSALMNDGYYSYALSSSGHARNGIWNYDEYDNAGAGRGYLGQPVGAATKVGNAYRRNFDNGIVLVNPTTAAVTVSLGGTFRKIDGTQDRTVNNGTDVTSVTLQPRDGIVLLKIAAVLPPADTASPVTTSDVKATYISSAVIRLASTDNVGVTASYFTLDGGAQTAGTTINVATAGSHTIQFWSADAAGNIEARKSASFTITVPLPAGTMVAAAGADQVTSADISIASAITGATEMRIDAGTGVFGSWIAYASTSQITLPAVGINTVRVEFRNAGGTLQLMDPVELMAAPAPVIPPVEPPVVPVEPPVVPVEPPVVPPVEPPVVPVEPPVVATVDLQTLATIVDYGKTTTLRMTVSPGASTAVRVDKRTLGSSSWTTFATMMTDAAGAATLDVTPLATTEYRTVIVDTGAVSGVVTVTVKTAATARSSRHSIRKRTLVQISGTVKAPVSEVLSAAADSVAATVSALDEVRAVLQRKVGDKWIDIKPIRMRSTGRYHIHVRPRVHGTYNYRICVLDSEGTIVGVSRTLKIRCR